MTIHTGQKFSKKGTINDYIYVLSVYAYWCVVDVGDVKRVAVEHSASQHVVSSADCSDESATLVRWRHCCSGWATRRSRLDDFLSFTTWPWFWFWNIVGKLPDVGMSRQRRVRWTTVNGSWSSSEKVLQRCLCRGCSIQGLCVGFPEIKDSSRKSGIFADDAAAEGLSKVASLSLHAIRNVLWEWNR